MRTSVRIPRDLVHRVSVPRWSALLAAGGKGRGLAKGATLDDVVTALRSGALSERSVDLLLKLRSLSTAESRDAIYEAAEDRGLDLSAWPEGDGPLDDAAHLLAEHPDDALGVVERALYRVARNAPKRPYRMYLASPGLGEGDFTAAKITKLEKRIAAHVGTRGATLYARVERIDDAAAPTVVVFEIVRAERTETPFALLTEKGKTSEGRVVYTPLTADVLRFDIARRRLSVGTSARHLAAVYRRLFGEVFFGDAEAFSSRRSCSLDRVLRHRHAALKVSGFDASIRSVRVIRLEWDSGHDETMMRRGRNSLEALARKEHHLQGGELFGVTLRFNFVDGDVVDVLLRIPNRVHWSPSRHDATIADWLDAARLTGAEPEPPDLLSLAPHDKPRRVWIATYGEAAVATMIARGFLVKSEARAVTHPDHPDGARDLVVFRTKSGDAWAIPDDADDEVAARTLSEEDLATQALDPLAAARFIAHAASLEGTPSEIEGRPGLFDAGRLPLGPTTLTPILVFAEPSARGLADELRVRALPGHPVLVVPRGRRLGVDVAQVEMPPLDGDFRELTRAMVHAVGLTKFVDVWLAAPMGTRLAIDRAAGEATLDGVRLKLGEQTLLFATLLADASGNVVPTATADRKLGGKTATTPAKFAKYRLVVQIREAFEAAGLAPPDDLATLVEQGGAGYRLTVPAFVR